MSLKMILLSFSENVFPCAIGVQAPRKCSYNIKEIKLHYRTRRQNIYMNNKILVAMTML